MKLSDYVAHFLARQGIRHVFAVSGGACLHLIHSVDATPGIQFVCPQHEQAGAMAADGYARVTGAFGAALATSGPGAGSFQPENVRTEICLLGFVAVLRFLRCDALLRTEANSRSMVAALADSRRARTVASRAR